MKTEPIDLSSHRSSAADSPPSVSLDELLADESARIVSREQPADLLNGVVIGTLVEFDDAGHPLVDFAGNVETQPVAARNTAVLDQSVIGRDVALAFESGDPRKPIVLGPIQQPQLTQVPDETHQDTAPLDAVVDGERIVLSADKEIVLRCGKASITLTRAGKILIRGAYLLSRSSGVNRIKGGSVQIN